MTFIIAVCTVKNSWWWTEGLSETCRFSFQKQKEIWEINASIWFHCKTLSRCTVTWTSNTTFQTFIILTTIKNSVIRTTLEWYLLGHPWPPVGHTALSLLRKLRVVGSV